MCSKKRDDCPLKKLFWKTKTGSSAPGREEFSELLNNCSPLAQKVLALARQEAERFHHDFVGTEHVLLGLINLGEGCAVTVLRKMGVVLEAVRLEVEKQVGTGPEEKVTSAIPYTPRVKKVLALAAKEAKKLHHTYIA